MAAASPIKNPITRSRWPNAQESHEKAQGQGAAPGMVSIPIPPIVRKAFEDLRREFVEKFGREPGPDDPVLFDPNKDVPTEIDPGDSVTEGELLAMFKEIGAGPEHVYAYKKTGRFGLPSTVGHWPEVEQAEWQAAIDEYFEIEGKASRDNYAGLLTARRGDPASAIPT